MKVSINNLKGYAELEKILEIAEITLEYINTDDSITIVGKVAGNTINTWILTEGLYLSKVIAQEVVQLVTKGKTPIGILESKKVA